MADDNSDRENITVQYTDVYGESKTFTFTNVTEVIHTGSGDPNKPWYVLIGQRDVEQGEENEVLEKVVRVQNEYIFDSQLPRSPTDPEKTVAEVTAEEMGFLN